MSLASYSDLLVTVTAWLNKPGLADLSTYVPDMVDMCASELNRRIRTRDMESVESGNLVVGDTLALPADYKKTKVIRLNVSGYWLPLQYVSAATYFNHNAWGATATGVPSHYTIIGSTIHFGLPPDDTYEYAHWYLTKIEALDSGNQSNWVLENHPDVYLYGTLKHAEPFLKNDARTALWVGMFETALRGIQDANNQDVPAGATAQLSEMVMP